jgi:hypothetical protein
VPCAASKMIRPHGPFKTFGAFLHEIIPTLGQRFVLAAGKIFCAFFPLVIFLFKGGFL